MIVDRLFGSATTRAAQATIERFFEVVVPDTSAGVAVSEENALKYSAVFSAVRLLADTMATLPLHVYRMLPGDRGKDRAREHYLYDLLHVQPNPEMSAATWKSLIMVHLNTWGNSYHEIERRNGQTVALWPHKPSSITPKRRENGMLYYEQTIKTGKREIPADRMLHISGLSLNGLEGLSPIGYHREAIGLGLATEKFGAKFFGNGARPTTVLKHPGKLSDTAEAHLRETWEKKQRGLDQAHRTAILEEGMDIETISIPPDEAQFLETRKFQITEVARIFRVPPHMIADMEHATFTNIEHQGIDYVTYSILPWASRIEQAIENQVLTRRERAEFFTEFLVGGLLRGDTEARFRAYATGRQWGWLSANDVRRLENMNPVEGGDIYLVPLNMIPAGQAALSPGSEDAVDDEDALRQLRPRLAPRSERSIAGRQRIISAHQGLLEDAALRIIRREKADVMREAEKRLRDKEGFFDWLDSFYQRHEAFVQRTMSPALFAFAEEVHAEAAEEVGGEATMTERVNRFTGLYLASYIRRHNGSSLGQIKSVVGDAVAEGVNPIDALEVRLIEWEEKRPLKIARWEAVQAGNAITRETYRENGISRIRWNAIGDTCPYCRSLNGRVIGIEGNFITNGEEFQPEGAEKPLTVSVDIGHPPAHAGCDCAISAA